MTARQIIVPGAQPSRDRNGRALPAKLRFYLPNTTTPAVVYTASDLVTPHPFPITTDSAGRWPSIWADSANTFDVVWSDLVADKMISGWSALAPLSDATLASVALAQDQADAAEASAALAAENATSDTAVAAAASATLAQQWATKPTGEVVTGEGYSALKYAGDASNSADAAAQSAVDAAAAQAGFTSVSVTPLTIGILNGVALTIEDGKQFQAGQTITVSDQANPAVNFMAGPVVSYDPANGALEFNSTTDGGSGSKSVWNVGLSGQQGPIGATTFATQSEAQAAARTDVSMSPARTDDTISARGRVALTLINAQTASYTTLATDRSKVVGYSGSGGAGVVLTLLAPAMAGAGFTHQVRNAASDYISITPASGTIDGQASIRAYPGEAFTLYSDGTNYLTIGRRKRVLVQTLAVVGLTTATFESAFVDPEAVSIELEAANIGWTGGGGTLTARLKFSGSYQTTSQYGESVIESGGGSAAGNNNVIPMSGFNLGANISGAIKVLNPLASSYTTIHAHMASAGYAQGIYGGTWLAQASACQGLQLTFPSAAAQGVIRCYLNRE